MKTLLIVISLLFTTSVYGQIGIGHSVPLWGKTIETAEISYQVDRISVHYFYNYLPDRYFSSNGKANTSKDTSTFAFGVRVIQSKYINFGGVASLNNFPTYDSTKLNFLIELKIPVKYFIISYKHISNGFGLIHSENQGYDSFSISYNF